MPAREQLGALVRRARPALESLGEYDRVAAELDRVAAELDRVAEQGNTGRCASCGRGAGGVA
ncbi:hypothetical protein AWC03_09980 [Mycobacterium europaeum]|nr:hypothetical protein AWC03_09980 [Mycobacterium europaeum]